MESAGINRPRNGSRPAWPVWILTGILLGACRQGADRIRPVRQDITESVYASGVVKSRNQYEAYGTVSGIIQEILVKEGDSVHRGQPLMRLAAETPQLNEQNARLAAEYADLKANRDRLDQLRIQSEQARTQLQHDSLQWERQRNLWAQQIGTRAELDQRLLAYQGARSAYEASLLAYEQTRRQLDFSSRQSKKNVQISQSLAGDYVLRSQVDGLVYQLLKKKGELVSPQSPVAVLGAAGAFYTELQVDEYDIARVRPGQHLLLTMDSYQGRVFEGVVEKIDPIMDERTRTFKVEAGFLNRPPVLYPNLSVESNIVISTRRQALTIPRTYLIQDSLVLIGTNRTRRVVPGLKDYQLVEIRSGLTPEEYIYKPAP
ncbi:MAG TPA: efflux RND transporter periplasmic adaptor subunit [Chitinophagaceae bacterium]|nr:efflux RND transporter periplasmic adaptor subunit [Chitinophagaceae bacterium]